jgi:hypothetical protein
MITLRSLPAPRSCIAVTIKPCFNPEVDGKVGKAAFASNVRIEQRVYRHLHYHNEKTAYSVRSAIQYFAAINKVRTSTELLPIDIFHLRK